MFGAIALVIGLHLAVTGFILIERDWSQVLTGFGIAALSIQILIEAEAAKKRAQARPETRKAADT